MSDAPRRDRLLANASALAERLAADGPLSIGAVARTLGIPRSSAYRLAEGLAGAGLVTVGDDGRVELARRWLRLADASRAGMTEWRGAGAVLAELAEATDQTAFLTVPTPRDAVCIDWAQGRGIAVLALRPGRALPLHAGAAGRVTLAFGPAAVAEAYLAGGPWTAATPRTLVDASALRADIALVRARGYAISDEDVTPGIRSLGMPILDGAGRLLGAVSVGGLAAESRARNDELVTALGRAAAALGVSGS